MAEPPGPPLARAARSVGGAAIRPRRLAAACLTAQLALGGCAERPPEWRAEEEYRWRPLERRGDAAGGFTSLSASRTGIAFRNDFSEESLLENDILANGSGVALGDFDGDGRTDVYLTSVEGPNVLYRNLGDWRFEDVTAWAGVALEGSVSRGAAWADVDGDGDADLLVTRHSRPNVLFRNDGPDGFTDISTEAGFTIARASHSLALGDVDGDGDLDLYIVNYKDRWARDVFAPAERTYDRVIGREGDRYFIRPGFEGYFRVVRTAEGWGRWEFAEPDEYYRNDGGRFTHIPFTDSTFRDEEGRPLTREPDEWGLAARFADLDLDGDLDLYVCNDINSPDHLWLNDGSGNFRLAPPLALRKTSAASMAVDVSDVDRDGWPDLFVAEMLGFDPTRRKTQVPEVDPDPARPGQVLARPQVKRNTLQMNRGDGTFAETALAAGAAASGWTWGAMFLDVDLDGYEDLLLTNGNVLDWLDGDAQERTQGVSAGDAWRRLRLQFPPLPLPNMAFRNVGDGTFRDASATWTFGAEPDISHGLAAGDLDGDGDLDVVINRLSAPALVLRNDAGAPRVGVRLDGGADGATIVGARVSLEFEGLPAQVREMAAAGLYLSDSADEMAFAAVRGASGRLVVRWPDGVVSVVDDARADRLYEVHRPGETAGREAPARPGSTAGEIPEPRPPRSGPAAPPLFEDASGALGHVHHEAIFDEFARQPLVPLRLAQLGPGVSWIDDDADGDPDLWIGAGRGGRIARYRNEGGAWRAELVGPPLEGDATTLLPAPPGTPGRVLAGQMNYEAAGPSEGRALSSVVALAGGAAREAVPGVAATTGPLASADYDGDGDLDLFVGGRVIPTAYPLSPAARFFLNQGGHWVEDAANAEAGRALGLISAAVFSDIDVDGDPDLLLATEWGPIRVLENDAGRFTDATAAWGLAALTGRWNGLATGDLNEDGRPDVVVTAWGDNTEAALDGAGRAILYGDVDRNGVFDVIELERRPDGTESPALRLDQLSRGLPALRRLTPDHQAFSRATLGTLGLEGGGAGVERVAAAELRHSLLLSGPSGFTVRPLPALAQRAPAFGVGIADVDGDGHDDVVLAQNFFATKLETPRYDAGRGLLLRGDGAGGLAPLSASESGIAAYGDGRGLALADYDADGRVDLVIGQNGSPTRLFHNRGAEPGLRVRLAGPPTNPSAVGAAVWVEYDDGRGPAREIRSGSGYWSHDDDVPVLGLRGPPRALRVRWPGGRETRVPIEPGTREVRASAASAVP